MPAKSQLATRNGEEKKINVPVPAQMAEVAASVERKRRSVRQIGPLKKGCSIRRGDLWELQKILDGKKCSLKKTYKCQAEAHDKVRARNRKTKKALDTLEILYERFEQVNSDLANVDKEFDKEFQEKQAAMEKVKESQRLMDISAQAVNSTPSAHTLFSCCPGGSRQRHSFHILLGP